MASELNKLLLGSYVSFAKPNYLLGSLKTALDCNENCFMIHIGSPQSTYKPNINDIKIAEFKKACSESNIKLDNVIIHAPYIINPSSNETLKQKFAISFIKQEVKFAEAIGCKYIVLHPGNATNGMDRVQAIKNSAYVINEVNKQNNGVVICVETMSGKGTEIGVNFSEIKQIIDLVENKELIGVCFDTCHTWDSGYDLNNYQSVFKELDKIVGLDSIKVLHINDSLNDCGAHKDRHANIGYGKIGFKNISSICYLPEFANIPKILETPVYENEETTYKKEIEMINENKFVDWIKEI